MSSDESKIVRESSLYEYSGLAKPLLTMIAQLQRPVDPDVKKPHQNEGWCDASQDYLAAYLGCCEPQVSRLIRRFISDGWLERSEWGSSRGRRSYRYRLTHSMLERIKALKMAKDEEHKFVRASRPSMRRKTSWVKGQNPNRQIVLASTDRLSLDQQTDCPSVVDHLSVDVKQYENLDGKQISKPEPPIALDSLTAKSKAKSKPVLRPQPTTPVGKTPARSVAPAPARKCGDCRQPLAVDEVEFCALCS